MGLPIDSSYGTHWRLSWVAVTPSLLSLDRYSFRQSRPPYTVIYLSTKSWRIPVPGVLPSSRSVSFMLLLRAIAVVSILVVHATAQTTGGATLVGTVSDTTGA